MRAAVLTVSDGVAAGAREDASGAVLAERPPAPASRSSSGALVPDERRQIADALWEPDRRRPTSC